MVPSCKRFSRRRRDDRRGIEIAELAFALPVMTVIVFGVLECCELLFAKQSLAVAAYEAGRVAARSDADMADVTTRFNQIVTARRIDNATLVVTPGSFAGLNAGDHIRVDVTAPVSGNTSTNLVLVGVPDLRETVTFVRE